MMIDPHFEQAVEDSSNRMLFENQVLTVFEAARWLKVSDRTLRKKISNRSIPFKRIGGRIRFYLPDLIRWLRKE